MRGLAVFSASDGRLLRWIVRSKSGPTPVSVSPDGRRVYYYNQAAPRGRCPRRGFTEPVLWRVPADGGRPLRAGLSTTSIAFSPDGRMLAYTSSRRCGRTVLIVIRDRRTGAARRIVLVRNRLSGNAPVFSAGLSWAPDDVHLAVAAAPAAAINTLEVINARRATDLNRAAEIRPCAGAIAECLDPAFDTRGRLTFLKWLNETGGSPEWLARWNHGHTARLLRLSAEQSAGVSASIAVDRAGNAVLLAGGLRQPEIWRWSSGGVKLILRSTRQFAVTSPLWVSGPMTAR